MVPLGKIMNHFKFTLQLEQFQWFYLQQRLSFLLVKTLNLQMMKS